MEEPSEQMPRLSNEGRPHVLSLRTKIFSIRCDVCSQLRDSFTAYVCSKCGFSAHPRCLGMVQPACKKASPPMLTSGTSVVLAPRHVGLAPVDLCDCDLGDSMMYLTSAEIWKARFVTLSQSGPFLDMFSSSPPLLLDAAIPVGRVHVGRVELLRDGITLQISGHNDRSPISFLCSNSETAKRWHVALKGRLSEIGPKEHDKEHELVEALVLKKNNCTFEDLVSGRASMLEAALVINADKSSEILSLRVESLQGFEEVCKTDSYFAIARIHAGGTCLADECYTHAASSPLWSEWLNLGALCSFPPEAVISISCYKQENSARLKILPKTVAQAKCLGHTSFALCNVSGSLLVGNHTLPLYPGEIVSLFHPSLDGSPPDGALMLCLTIGAHSDAPRVYLDSRPCLDPISPPVAAMLPVSLFANPIQFNPLQFSASPAAWENRFCGPDGFLAAVLSADLSSPLHRAQLHELASIGSSWSLSPLLCLHLLSGRVVSSVVRTLAMRMLLEAIDTTELRRLAISLVSCLRSEPHSWSAASELLLRRVASDPVLATGFFWAARGQMGVGQPLSCRFEEWSSAVAAMQSGLTLTRDVETFSRLEAAACDKRRRTALDDVIEEQKWTDERWMLPNGKVVGAPASWSVLGSSAGPLMLVFDRASLRFEARGAKVSGRVEIGVARLTKIVKFGDDLRQDAAMMLLGHFMNQIWKIEQLNAYILTYDVVPTMYRVGMIQVIPDCSSLAAAQGIWRGAFQRKALTEHLKDRTPATMSWEAVVANYRSSLVGLILFEYICGLGDRHSENLLLSRDGYIFHIDFALVCGSDYGVAASVPFSLTYQMLDPLGGLTPSFEDLICNGFLALRRHSSLILGLAMLAISSPMKCMGKVEDLAHLHRALMLDETDEIVVRKRFKALVNTVLTSMASQINDALHQYYMSNFAEKAYK